MAGEMLYHCWLKIKDQDDESSDLKWSMLLDLLKFLDNDRVHEFSSCIYIIFSVVVKECDKIYHLGRNKCFEFITLL